MEKIVKFSEGETVRVKEGTFTSFFGAVVKVDNARGRLSVEGRFEGRPGSELAVLNVSSYSVEKIDPPNDSR